MAKINSQYDQDTLVNPKHNPTVAALLSVIPGLGQMYNKRYIKGAVLFILFAAFVIVMIDFITTGLQGLITLGEVPREDDSRVFLSNGVISLIFTVFFLGFYCLNIQDALKDAKRIQLGWKVPNMREGFRNAWDTSFPYLLIAPGLFLLMFVVVFPLLYMVFIAFTNFNLYNAPPREILEWIGFQNFINLFTINEWRNTFVNVLSWTLIWTFVATTLQIALAMFLAVITNHPRLKFKKLIRTVFILPWAVPAFVTIIIFSALFHDTFGAINTQIIIPLFGEGIPWLQNATWTKIALIMIQVWLGFPFIYALFTGVLQGISSDWYEAADIDGASRWQKFRNITFPHLMFATAPLLIMQYSFNFNNFNVIYLFNQGGPAVRGQTAGGSDILISWVFGLTFENQQYNMAAAVSIILGLLVATFAFFQFRRSRSFKEEGTF
ncbi:sugar ABC transporter permease [Salipaludibacillus agaradhaerens]|jgi:arabinogalactan oligomer/maltooligosaccharide transport system permease protein|uniref:Maltose/maltodextrin transport system permease protein n=1 Tax=Salipaludibacillus agaradhaerens TaxID=76935 RepID=A0A9Q4AZR2_SALAG|nr:sugar ABC transporter permease [Salipaludibacillus agaradhaerens]UJW58417.1 sugar ABC transporter permease [Bacillus sp. A116_S68]MCR6095752.1 sugar ABC transporter permease [Salipaludibacillus agaradhaerens]MCR6107358.1 sugar ABC transporter permease [Salipaludibacillus agaradhaerens]MCR6114688.1 sugar ABC transporter permease [Salipaludibacillus agaradhaerens]MCR6119387.1 sugar ABC transporter permease [Salipaludibacillus agaradhaerens]